MRHPAGRGLRAARTTVRRALAGVALIGAPAGTVPAATPAQRPAATVAQPATVVVPPVVGLTADSASRVLTNVGLRPVRVSRRAVGTVTGTVIGQSPPARRTVKRGDLDTIFVATVVPLDARLNPGAAAVQPTRTRVPTMPPQPTTVLVPALAGASLRTALITLRERGLRLGAVSPLDTSAARGTIVGQRPNGGTQAPRGSAVAVDTSTGMVIVPDLRKQTLAAARALARPSGLVVRIGSVAQSVDVAFRDSVVSRQEPPNGARVPSGSPVRVTITAFSQALSDSVAGARRDSIDQARRDSANRARQDSANRARQDSANRARQDSANRARQDSISRADSIEKARAESVALATRPATVPETIVHVAEPVGPFDWTWILVIAGLAGLGVAALVIKRFIRPPGKAPPESPKPPPRSLPAAGITAGVSGDPPAVSLYSDSAELRGPEIELYTVGAPMEYDVAAADESLVMEERVDAQR